VKAEWYLAELVIKITVADDPRNVVHQNRILIRADSAEEAYEKAIQFGKKEEISYDNLAGKAVLYLGRDHGSSCADDGSRESERIIRQSKRRAIYPGSGRTSRSQQPAGPWTGSR
jgi:hypothetical protein